MIMMGYIRKLINNKRLQRVYNSAAKGYLDYYQKVIRCNPEILATKRHYEEEWLRKWRKYDKKLSPLAYRVFSYYIGENINIMPMELCINIVERVLTPPSFSNYYSDKNSLGKIVPKEYFPPVFLRNVRNSFYDGEYVPLVATDVDRLICNLSEEKVMLKPARLDSGKGIDVFYKSSDGFYNKNHDRLSKEYLDAYYKQDYLIQRCLVQSDFTAQFNPSSVNTIRIATYRDIKGQVHPLEAVLRIGAKGAVVDNSHSGGVACGIGKNGEIGKYICDIHGNKQAVFNGIDFSNNHLLFPNYREIQQFAVSVSQHVLHHDLVALDIALDAEDKPTLLEINTYGFAGWIFQLLSGPIFGEYTDEVMERCYSQLSRLGLCVSIDMKK